MSFMKYISLLLVVGGCCGEYTIFFDPKFSPPQRIPNDFHKVYSVPLNQQIGKPIHAYLQKDGFRVTEAEHGSIANSPFTVESIDIDVYNKKNGAVDRWKNGGGELCQFAYNMKYPQRLSREYAKHYCGTNETRTKLYMDLRAYDGMIIAEALYHKHRNYRRVPRKKRIFLFTVILPDSTVVKQATHPVLVETPAWSLKITKLQKYRMPTNWDITFIVNIFDVNRRILKTGLGSSPYIELRTSWEHTTFFACCHKNMMFAKTEATLAGENVKVHATYRDKIFRQRAVKGIAVFKHVRVMDLHNRLRINATMIQPSDPWHRTPNIYKDVINMQNIVMMTWKGYQNMKVYRYQKRRRLDPAVAVTRIMRIIDQLAWYIVVTNPIINLTIGANTHIPGLILEVQDSKYHRISSGKNGQQKVIVYTYPSTRISLASRFSYSRRGRTYFNGSVCEPRKKLQFSFGMRGFSVNWDRRKITPKLVFSTKTEPIEVTDTIFIAHFDDVNLRDRSHIGSMQSAFMQYALKDLNEGVYPKLLTNRRLFIKTYHVDFNDKTSCLRQFNKMIQDGKVNMFVDLKGLEPYLQDKPDEHIKAIIGVGGNRCFKDINQQRLDAKVIGISIKEDKPFFSPDFQYFYSLCWTKKTMFERMFAAFHIRRWETVVFLRHESIETELMMVAAAAKINITEVVYRNNSKEALINVKKTNRRIILYTMPKALMHLVIREAFNFQISPLFGYQWVTYGQNVIDFPWNNEGEECQKEPPCTVIFKGLHGFMPHYNISGLANKDWLRVLDYHAVADPSEQKGKSKITSSYFEAASYGMAYDAIIILAEAFTYCIKLCITLEPRYIGRGLYKVKYDGLSGHIEFKYRVRTGFQGLLITVNPTPPIAGIPRNQVEMLNRLLDIDGSEIPLEATFPLNSPPWNFTMAPMAFPTATYINKILIKSSTGMYSYHRMALVSRPNDSKPPHLIYIRENTVAPFYCVKGCGGQIVDESNILEYEFGTCVEMNKCRCHDGYSNDKCEVVSCNCKNARVCVPYFPNICRCLHGWTGKRCGMAICTPQCEHGKCTSPFTCTCDSFWIGPACRISILFLIFVTFSSLITSGFAMYYLFHFILKRQANKVALQNMDWLVLWDDEVDETTNIISFVASAKSMNEFTDIHTVTWKHQNCYVEKFDIDSVDVTKKRIRQEIVNLREVRHCNIVMFIGACMDAPHVCLLVEFCGKGSLEDIINNQSVTLSWDFRFSILKDICSGMRFLHKSVILSHGRLKSSNCLVDNRWTCKIAGHGCPTLRYDAPRLFNPEFIKVNPSYMFWTAPELLRNCTVNCLDEVRCGTQQGDVYSFGIILSEIISCERPYTTELSVMNGEDIIEVLKNKDSPECKDARQVLQTLDLDFSKGLRPFVDRTLMPGQKDIQFKLLKMLHQTWHEHPAMRPTFRSLLNELSQIHPVKENLIDNLVRRLEKYSNNLESVVVERTKELMIEKHRTEILVRQMLPKNVIDGLKLGYKVDPESFDSVTIFFSDIVGFTMITQHCSPVQVVELLNDLYTRFDEILDVYDVYKVETIGDAYMVVSGLPFRNGDLHAGAIATMSLDLMSCMTTFKVEYMHDQLLQLRIGMHTGPCVAGVVGLKMPRYCLFGDTVNTASRMETSSLALRIHMSETVHDILEKLGGYNMEFRGTREIKGKGPMKTFWLQGKDGFTKPMPDLSLALSLSKHDLK